jgi:hypothetical protein
MSDHALDLLPATDSPRKTSAFLRGSGLVFVGVKLTWEPRLSDHSLLTSVAESWEDVFGHWSNSDGSIHVGHSAVGYCVDLNPGNVQLMLQIPELALPLANRQLSELLTILHGRGRKGVSALLTAQFLHPATAGFEELLRSMSGKLFQLSFLERLGADVHDMSYLMDLVIDQQWFQISAGALRADEVLDRVASTKLSSVPDTSLFISVSTRWSVAEGDLQLSPHLQKVLVVGENLAKELRI